MTDPELDHLQGRNAPFDLRTSTVWSALNFNAIEWVRLHIKLVYDDDDDDDDDDEGLYFKLIARVETLHSFATIAKYLALFILN